MYRGRLWTMRQYAGFGTAEESNERYKYLLNQGQTGLSVAFDLPTQIGYDSSDQMSIGEVGKVGVAIDSLKDMEILFGGIPLDKVSTSMTINAPASVLLAFYIAVAEKQGVTKNQLTGTIQNDILKEYIARGTYIFPPTPSLRLITNIFDYCSKEVPKWNTISISGYHIREAGSTAAQEVAFTIADGIEYVKAALDTGMDVDVFAKRLSFFFNSHNDLLEEIAKFRAARRIWAKIMKERFKAKSPNSMKSGVANTIDPFAGSYIVEELTDKIEQEVMEYITKIDDIGGMVKAIEKGFIQKQIQDSAYKYQKEIERAERVIVGVNKFTAKEEQPNDILEVNPKLREVQIQRINEVKENRSNESVQKKLIALKKAASTTDNNLMPLILDAVREYATLGEICNVLRKEFGEYKESIVL